MKCYGYNYNHDVTNLSKCKGSFDECRRLVDCDDDDKNQPVCFAMVKFDAGILEGILNNRSIRATTDLPKLKITSAGCFVHPQGKPGTGRCPANYTHTPNHDYMCFCTESECNRELVPLQLPFRSSESAPSTTPAPPGSPEPLPVINHSVMLLVVMIILVVTAILGIFYQRLRPKRHTSSANRLSNHKQIGARSTEANTVGNHAGADVSILVPFRSSFDDEGGNYQYGQRPQVSHLTSGTTTNNQINGTQPQEKQDQKFNLEDIKLLEMVGSGRFGTVHRANLVKRPQRGKDDRTTSNCETSNLQPTEGSQRAANDDCDEDQELLQVDSEIAVKIIPNNELQSWQNELKIYNSSRTRHPNILTYLGSCESPQTNSNWLLVEYASNGSLHHYLKENPVSWQEFLSISLGIVRGLSHLHDADIAHRDFKSKNVLLRRNLSPCVTDFGVAAMLDITGGSHSEQKKKYLQVGTPRYMAPEVLECSVSFTKISFTKIDVYALSLVLWELLSRCHPLPKLRVSDYDDSLMPMPMPFAHPTSEPFMIPPPLESSHPITSTPQKQPLGVPMSAQDEPRMIVQPHQQQSTGTNGEGASSHDGNHFGPSDAASLDTVDAAHHEGRLQLQRILDERKDEVPPYKVPFEDEVGPNPDINAMRQVVVSDKKRPPIRPEWRFYPIAKLCQAIVDGWEYDHDARISASCFVERIETMMQLLDENVHESGDHMARRTHAQAETTKPPPPTTTKATMTMTTPMIATTTIT